MKPSKAAQDRVVLRWHLSRIYQQERFSEDEERPIDVTIRCGSRALDEKLDGRGIEALLGVPIELLEWWDADCDRELRGWAREATLSQGVVERNAVVEKGDPTLATEPRQLAEDMVLIQELPSRQAWDQALAAQNSSTDMINLDSLAEQSGSRWLDFTQPARQATKQIYRRVLGEAGERGGDYSAAKR